MVKKPELKVIIEYGEDRVERVIPLRGESLYRIDWKSTCFGIPATADGGHVLHDVILCELLGIREPYPPRARPLWEACRDLCMKIATRLEKL